MTLFEAITRDKNDPTYTFNVLSETISVSQDVSAKLSELRVVHDRSIDKKIVKVKVYRGHDFSQSQFSNIHFVGCTFHDVNLKNAQFNHCTFEQCTFQDCSLVGARFGDTEINGVVTKPTFHQCHIASASFKNATLQNVSFVDNIMPNASFNDATLKSCIFTKCEVTGMSFKNATCEGDNRLDSFCRGRRFLIEDFSGMKGGFVSLPLELIYRHSVNSFIADEARFRISNKDDLKHDISQDNSEKLREIKQSLQKPQPYLPGLLEMYRGILQKQMPISELRSIWLNQKESEHFHNHEHQTFEDASSVEEKSDEKKQDVEQAKDTNVVNNTEASEAKKATALAKIKTFVVGRVNTFTTKVTNRREPKTSKRKTQDKNVATDQPVPRAGEARVNAVVKAPVMRNPEQVALRLEDQTGVDVVDEVPIINSPDQITLKLAKEVNLKQSAAEQKSSSSEMPVSQPKEVQSSLQLNDWSVSLSDGICWLYRPVKSGCNSIINSNLDRILYANIFDALSIAQCNGCGNIHCECENDSTREIEIVRVRLSDISMFELPVDSYSRTTISRLQQVYRESVFELKSLDRCDSLGTLTVTPEPGHPFFAKRKRITIIPTTTKYQDVIINSRNKEFPQTISLVDINNLLDQYNDALNPPFIKKRIQLLLKILDLVTDIPLLAETKLLDESIIQKELEFLSNYLKENDNGMCGAQVLVMAAQYYDAHSDTENALYYYELALQGKLEENIKNKIKERIKQIRQSTNSSHTSVPLIMSPSEVTSSETLAMQYYKASSSQDAARILEVYKRSNVAPCLRLIIDRSGNRATAFDPINNHALIQLLEDRENDLRRQLSEGAIRVGASIPLLKTFSQAAFKMGTLFYLSESQPILVKPDYVNVLAKVGSTAYSSIVGFDSSNKRKQIEVRSVEKPYESFMILNLLRRLHGLVPDHNYVTVKLGGSNSFKKLLLSEHVKPVSLLPGELGSISEKILEMGGYALTWKLFELLILGKQDTKYTTSFAVQKGFRNSWEGAECFYPAYSEAAYGTGHEKFNWSTFFDSIHPSQTLNELAVMELKALDPIWVINCWVEDNREFEKTILARLPGSGVGTRQDSSFVDNVHQRFDSLKSWILSKNSKELTYDAVWKDAVKVKIEPSQKMPMRPHDDPMIPVRQRIVRQILSSENIKKNIRTGNINKLKLELDNVLPHVMIQMMHDIDLSKVEVSILRAMYEELQNKLKKLRLPSVTHIPLNNPTQAHLDEVARYENIHSLELINGSGYLIVDGKRLPQVTTVHATGCQNLAIHAKEGLVTTVDNRTVVTEFTGGNTAALERVVDNLLKDAVVEVIDFEVCKAKAVAADGQKQSRRAIFLAKAALARKPDDSELQSIAERNTIKEYRAELIQKAIADNDPQQYRRFRDNPEESSQDGANEDSIRKVLLPAVKKGNEALVKEILKDVVPPPVKQDMLFAAVMLNCDVVTQIVESGSVDVNAVNSEGVSPLLQAVESKNANAVSVLVYHGATVGRPLIKALQIGSPEDVIDALIHLEARITESDVPKIALLAAERGNLNILAWLLHSDLLSDLLQNDMMILIGLLNKISPKNEIDNTLLLNLMRSLKIDQVNAVRDEEVDEVSDQELTISGLRSCVSGNGKIMTTLTDTSIIFIDTRTNKSVKKIKRPNISDIVTMSMDNHGNHVLLMSSTDLCLINRLTVSTPIVWKGLRSLRAQGITLTHAGSLLVLHTLAEKKKLTFVKSSHLCDPSDELRNILNNKDEVGEASSLESCEIVVSEDNEFFVATVDSKNIVVGALSDQETMPILHCKHPVIKLQIRKNDGVYTICAMTESEFCLFEMRIENDRYKVKKKIVAAFKDLKEDSSEGIHPSIFLGEKLVNFTIDASSKAIIFLDDKNNLYWKPLSQGVPMRPSLSSSEIYLSDSGDVIYRDVRNLYCRIVSEKGQLNQAQSADSYQKTAQDKNVQDLVTHFDEMLEVERSIANRAQQLELSKKSPAWAMRVSTLLCLVKGEREKAQQFFDAAVAKDPAIFKDNFGIEKTDNPQQDFQRLVDAVDRKSQESEKQPQAIKEQSTTQGVSDQYTDTDSRSQENKDNYAGKTMTDPSYWYSIHDGICLLRHIRNQLPLVVEVEGDRNNPYQQNTSNIFLADPYYHSNFANYFTDDLQRVRVEGVFSGLRAWTQMPKKIVIPVLNGRHFVCVMVEINYEKTQESKYLVKIRWKDPYGKQMNNQEFSHALRNGCLLLIRHQNDDDNIALTDLEVFESSDLVDQQGLNINGSDCGVITFSNISDYVSNPEGPFTIQVHSYSGHARQIQDRRVADLKIVGSDSQDDMGIVAERIIQLQKDQSEALQKRKHDLESDPKIALVLSYLNDQQSTLFLECFDAFLEFEKAFQEFSQYIDSNMSVTIRAQVDSLSKQNDSQSSDVVTSSITQQNMASRHFQENGMMRFDTDYDVNTLTYLVHLQGKASCLKYVFKSGLEGHYIKHLEELKTLTIQFNCPTLFISPSPAVFDNPHFICGVLFQDQLLLINPLGAALNKDVISILREITDESKKRIVKRIYVTNNVIQQDPEGQSSSCGPICVELMLKLSEQLATLCEKFADWSNMDSDKFNEIDGLRYLQVTLDKAFLTDELDGLSKNNAVDVMKKIRERHAEILCDQPVVQIMNQTNSEQPNEKVQNQYLLNDVMNAPEQELVWKLAEDNLDLVKMLDEASYLKLKKRCLPRGIESDKRAPEDPDSCQLSQSSRKLHSSSSHGNNPSGFFATTSPNKKESGPVQSAAPQDVTPSTDRKDTKVDDNTTVTADNLDAISLDFSEEAKLSASFEILDKIKIKVEQHEYADASALLDTLLLEDSYFKCSVLEYYKINPSITDENYQAFALRIRSVKEDLVKKGVILDLETLSDNDQHLVLEIQNAVRENRYDDAQNALKEMEADNQTQVLIRIRVDADSNTPEKIAFIKALKEKMAQYEKGITGAKIL